MMKFPKEAIVFKDREGHILEGAEVSPWSSSGDVWLRVRSPIGITGDYGMEPIDWLTPLTPAACTMLEIARQWGG